MLKSVVNTLKVIVVAETLAVYNDLDWDRQCEARESPAPVSRSGRNQVLSSRGGRPKYLNALYY